MLRNRHAVRKEPAATCPLPSTLSCIHLTFFICHLCGLYVQCAYTQVKEWLAGDEPVLQLTLGNSFERLLCYQVCVGCMCLFV